MIIRAIIWYTEFLGISFEEGENIDLYQNKGRFLYKYAGSFLEEAAVHYPLTKNLVQKILKKLTFLILKAQNLRLLKLIV